MKHIKKKCINGLRLSDDIADMLNSVEIKHNEFAKLTQINFEGHYAMALTSSNELVQTFKYQKNKRTFFIPEANPIVIYFHVAQTYLRPLNESKADLLLKCEGATIDMSELINDAYNYFSQATVCGTFLFNALEAFVNFSIPDTYEYKLKTEKRLEVYNKQSIQRWLSFEEKIKKVLPDATKKTFHIEYPSKFETIRKLNDLRDEIVHTKTDLLNKPNWYEKLYTNLLEFNFPIAIRDVKDYINFYSPNLIEECNCGKDF